MNDRYQGGICQSVSRLRSGRSRPDQAFHIHNYERPVQTEAAIGRPEVDGQQGALTSTVQRLHQES